jgi:hypothetical protein
MQTFVNDNGKHTSRGEQHELTMHTEVFDAQICVILLHGSKIEHRIPGAHWLLLLIVW